MTSHLLLVSGCYGTLPAVSREN